MSKRVVIKPYVLAQHKHFVIAINKHGVAWRLNLKTATSRKVKNDKGKCRV